MADKGTRYHHGSHERLLSSLAGPPPADHGIEAIIVPTARPVEYLTKVADLALTLELPLVTLHSGRRTWAAKAAEYLPKAIELIAIDVPPAHRLRFPRFMTSDLLAGSPFERDSDLSAKRNLALELSHMLGWSRIFFLDDDITILSPEDVRRAGGLLDSYNAIGFHIGEFPDNSVVCHAYRQAGGVQKTFVGAGALAVEISRCDSFFPDIYNDDWFFLLDGDRRLQPTAVIGQGRQESYDPFESPDRAQSEEFGDVLAEGLFWLLDQDLSINDADLSHWLQFLVHRRNFIETVLDMVREDNLAEPDMKQRIDSLEASLGRLALITPALCVDYLRAWQADRHRWRRHVASLPTHLQVDQAIAQLSRKGSPPLEWCTSQPSSVLSLARIEPMARPGHPPQGSRTILPRT